MTREVPKPNLRATIVLSRANDKTLRKIEYDLQNRHDRNMSRSFIIDHVLSGIDAKAVADELAKL